jgi:hypothetical protein
LKSVECWIEAINQAESDEKVVELFGLAMSERDSDIEQQAIIKGVTDRLVEACVKLYA